MNGYLFIVDYYYIVIDIFYLFNIHIFIFVFVKIHVGLFMLVFYNVNIIHMDLRIRRKMKNLDLFDSIVDYIGSNNVQHYDDVIMDLNNYMTNYN
jgi:hypothetical protein